MDFELSADQRMLRDTVRRFVTDKVVPHARDWDRTATFPHAVVQELGSMGLLGITCSPSYGGAGLGAVEQAVVVEEVARGDGSLALTVASHNGLCSGHIGVAGTAAQKERYLRPLALGHKLGAWALTEPGSGSDAAALCTTARREGDMWHLRGAKNFITQGSVGDIFVVLASTDASLGRRGITAFILERDAPQFTRTVMHGKLGMRSSDTGMLSFDNTPVPDAQRLGEVGRGFLDTLHILDRGRISIGALAVGLGLGALAGARRYALERHQFGRPIAEFQAIQWKLADMATELQAARLLVYSAAAQCDAGHKNITQAASMAKLFASEAALRATDAAVQIHGGYGYIDEFPAERALRDAKLCTIGEGTSEVQRLIIARQLLQQPAAA